LLWKGVHDMCKKNYAGRLPWSAAIASEQTCSGGVRARCCSSSDTLVHQITFEMLPRRGMPWIPVQVCSWLTPRRFQQAFAASQQTSWVRTRTARAFLWNFRSPKPNAASRTLPVSVPTCPHGVTMTLRLVPNCRPSAI